MSTPENSSEIFIDNYGRRMNYLRLAVTDRCNLRCRYCMPEEGVPHVPKENLLSWEENLRLSGIMINHGVTKIRITGGEPFVRKGLTGFLEQLKARYPDLNIGITTNAVLLERHLERLKSAGITSLNISLDSLSPEGFYTITRRDNFHDTWDAIQQAINMGFDIKINMVIQAGLNDHEILDFADLTETLPINVRYIEPMPFSGDLYEDHQSFSFKEIKKELAKKYVLIPDGTAKSGVANQFKIEGHPGKIGIINAYSRTFCATCSRMRVSALGQMRTCLYGENVLDLRELFRCGSPDSVIADAIQKVLNQRFKDGFEAENHRKEKQFESMSAIGG
ncbi:GTP 3',8-cyclase MoaA [Aliifodinibius sp. S!AR15-10]|uniref:GTP 3',8-cyclase MoaA n=1 Tax=Aliifodinibius sp. S!AR15-10 TaxID=2950437 RepID=UPI00285B1D51|nr:GTP 3',8-cyclase MoaA [Aliifodinibius sp. S!AR15-10]MDR8390723.1 GTP 3',8-cyclase MoaA [Aliifodinibius sp. S!AR15-10]